MVRACEIASSVILVFSRFLHVVPFWAEAAQGNAADEDVGGDMNAPARQRKTTCNSKPEGMRLVGATEKRTKIRKVSQAPCVPPPTT